MENKKMVSLRAINNMYLKLLREKEEKQILGESSRKTQNLGILFVPKTIFGGKTKKVPLKA